MKRILVGTLLAVILLAGCESVGLVENEGNVEIVVNPLVGAWESDSTAGAAEQVIELNANGDVQRTDTVEGVETTTEGTWTSNDTTLTITWDDESVAMYSYVLDVDESTLTLFVGGFSRTYHRQ